MQWKLGTEKNFQSHLRSTENVLKIWGTRYLNTTCFNSIYDRSNCETAKSYTKKSFGKESNQKLNILIWKKNSKNGNFMTEI